MLISQSGPWAGLSFSTVLLQKVGFFNYKRDENMDNGILDTAYAPQNLFWEIILVQRKIPISHRIKKYDCTRVVPILRLKGDGMII